MDQGCKVQLWWWCCCAAMTDQLGCQLLLLLLLSVVLFLLLLPPRDEEHELLAGTAGASSLSSVFTLCNTAIGAGVLGLPYAFKCSGKPTAQHSITTAAAAAASSCKASRALPQPSSVLLESGPLTVTWPLHEQQQKCQQQQQLCHCINSSSSSHANSSVAVCTF